MEEKTTTAKKTPKADPLPPEPDMERRVSIYIPKGGAGEDEVLFVGLNNKNWLLPRGKSSTIPYAVALEAKRALDAREKLDARISSLLNAGIQSSL